MSFTVNETNLGIISSPSHFVTWPGRQIKIGFGEPAVQTFYCTHTFNGFFLPYLSFRILFLIDLITTMIRRRLETLVNMQLISSLFYSSTPERVKRCPDLIQCKPYYHAEGEGSKNKINSIFIFM